ncbi:MAG: di-trans,poly-cis-decaprenylcistransferase [Dehalococcoidales bacterium]|nr:di-trans,poly-cis-decaprenylcistransferase [Dehalococcoidales bacterium]
MIGTSPTTKRIALLPNHVAIIMDGNGRWAEKQGLPRLEGHRAGVENIRPIIECLDEYRIRCVTLYAFSTENWDRPEDEINGLLYLLEEALDKEVPKLHKRGIRIRHIGRLEELAAGPQLAIRKAIELTKNNTGITFSFAFNYGGRIEILDAVRCIIAKGIPPENIDENLFNSYLYTASLPNVDLLIRTGGELRISNFLLWQAAYSEYYFTEVLWPDFDRKEVEKALIAYSQRQRRFGGL